MRCAHCGRTGAEATVLSTHPTSEGSVRYRRCVCGSVSIELVTRPTEATVLVEAMLEPTSAR